MSQGDEPSRKRVSSRQLTDRDDVDDEVENGDAGTWRKADANTMQTRKIAKVRGKGASSDVVASTSPPTATEAAPAKSFSFAGYKQDDKKEEAKPSTPEKAPQETNGTPAKETPSEDATPAESKETPATPTKEATPAKEATPTKEATKEATPVKEAESKEATTPAKDSTPAKTEGTPEAPKPFSFPTTFSFPTSFTSTPFSFPTLSSTTTPAFSSTTPAFSGFGFPATNFSASGGGSSVFSAGGAAKGSDDEGEDAPNPEEEVAITGPNTMPLVQTLTGEEDETTLFTVRAKLLAFVDGKWQERGVGQFKLNQDKESKCRLLMRDQGGKHLRLNTPLFAEMKVDKPNDKSVQFVAIGNGGSEVVTTKPFTTFALRVARKEEATDLFEALNKHKPSSSSSSSSSTSSTSTTTTASEST